LIIVCQASMQRINSLLIQTKFVKSFHSYHFNQLLSLWTFFCLFTKRPPKRLYFSLNYNVFIIWIYNYWLLIFISTFLKVIMHIDLLLNKQGSFKVINNPRPKWIRLVHIKPQRSCTYQCIIFPDNFVRCHQIIFTSNHFRKVVKLFRVSH